MLRRRFLAGSAALLASATRAASRVDGAAAGATELLDGSAVALSRAIHARRIGCEELMRATLTRIAALNPAHNALVALRDGDLLLDEARQADRALARGESRGWMHGFPHAVKDLIDVRGLPTTAGSPILAGAIATDDALVTRRLRDAGAVIIGKSNVPEFGLGSHTYNPVYGATHNAWRHGLSAGGSSGGAACALALGLVPVADGSDLMGSLRNPAAWNNVIGLRPTPGLVPLSPGFTQELACLGPMARTVTDTAWLLATLAGPAPGYPGSRAVDRAALTAPLVPVTEGLRLAWLGDFDGYLPFEEGVLDVCEQALSRFSEHGAVVEPVTPAFSMERLWRCWLSWRHWLVRGRLLSFYEDPVTRRQLKPEARWEIEGGAGLSADDLRDAMRCRDEWYATVHDLLDRFDALVLPSAQLFPFAVEKSWPNSIAGRAMDSYHRWMEVVVPGTLSGCPVVNVPAGFDRRGLPMGLQLIGRRGGERPLLELAFSWEQVTRWNLEHRAPVLQTL